MCSVALRHSHQLCRRENEIVPAASAEFIQKNASATRALIVFRIFIPMKKAPDWALWSLAVLAIWPFNVCLVFGAAYARNLKHESGSRSLHRCLL
jgi:hypothetical protein